MTLEEAMYEIYRGQRDDGETSEDAALEAWMSARDGVTLSFEQRYQEQAIEIALLEAGFEVESSG